ncbi:MAG: hypothetical protein F6K28_10530 [Microcoleus sp. SIO2G3]|nr:hypothetical protein [Microcoleus sp. SIO2G3]
MRSPQVTASASHYLQNNQNAIAGGGGFRIALSPKPPKRDNFVQLR